MTVWVTLAATLNLVLGCYLIYHVVGALSSTAPPELSVYPSVTVVVPARNEGNTLNRCLAALADQDYPAGQWEVIVVDDRSTDKTREVAEANAVVYAAKGLTLQVTTLTGAPGTAPKKEALTVGIALAKGEIILTTDADCMARRTWVSSMAAQFTERTVAVVGPLCKHYSTQNTTGNPLTWLQALEAAGLMLLAVGGAASHMPGMANGANLGFRKRAFTEVGGYTGTEQVASGDDELLLHKLFQKYPKGIRAAYTRKTLVTAYPETQLKSLWQQRIRWVSKGRAYRHTAFQAARVLAYLATAGLIPLAMVTLAGASYLVQTVAWSSLAFRLVAECAVLLPALYVTRQMRLALLLPWVQPLYWLYLLIIGPAGTLWPSYSWKGRRLQ